MNFQPIAVAMAGAVLFSSWLGQLPSCWAHGGTILVQGDGLKLVTGYDAQNGTGPRMDARAIPMLYTSSLVDTPSFSSYTNAPAGSEPLPSGGDLYWDFLPMNHQGITSNLLYWDATGTQPSDVDFAELPQDDISLKLYTEGFFDSAEIHGEPEMIPGKRIGRLTESNEKLHAHRSFNISSDSSLPEGIYLFAMHLRMEGYATSDPFFIAASTFAISPNTLYDLALPWVEAQADSLILKGDYNFDGSVDGGDFLAWQREFGSTGPFPSNGTYADGDGDREIGAGDLAVWAEQYAGDELAALEAATVPEPPSMWLGAAIVVLSYLQRPRGQDRLMMAC